MCGHEVLLLAVCYTNQPEDVGEDVDPATRLESFPDRFGGVARRRLIPAEYAVLGLGKQRHTSSLCKSAPFFFASL